VTAATSIGLGAAELEVDCRCELGECVLWSPPLQALFWTDITGRRLWSHRPADGVLRHFDVPAKLGCFGFLDDGRLLLGLAKGLSLAELDPGAAQGLRLTHLVDVEPDIGHTRVNDGRADRHGNFVFGTMSDRDSIAHRGNWYQFSFGHGLRRLALPSAAIPNSICFSRDGGTLYFCDSRAPEILCCDYEPKAARVSNVRVFARLSHAAGSPDGSAIDADGCLWNAQWGASRVVCYARDGSELGHVTVPVKNPSCCAFGGAAFDRLYVSTAREDMSPAELGSMPLAGGVFGAAIPGAQGLPESLVAAA